jgi:cellulose synthase operon protein C
MKNIILFSTAFLLVATSFAQSSDAHRRGALQKMTDMTLKKLSAQLPASKLSGARVVSRDVTLIKPPSSTKFYVYDENPLKSEYNKLLDQEIKKLYALSRKYKTSKNRGEIWLRLAERFVEKGKIIEMKVQDNYEKKLGLWENKKIKRKPVLAKNPGKNYYLRAIQLYEWFIRDFPRDGKVPQALYFLGYSNFESGSEKKGAEYFRELTQRFPTSVYVDEAHFALGEYYFEKEAWSQALEQYHVLVAKKSARLFGFSLYKSAWCHYRMGKFEVAVDTLERVIRLGDGGGGAVEGTKEVDKLRLRAEAIKDYVAFYSQTGKYKEAEPDFVKTAGNEKKALELLEALAYRYSYSGNVTASTYLFKKLIANDQYAEKAAKYQYQIVQDYLNINNLKAFRQELVEWVEQYGPASAWAQKNSNNKELVKETFALQETTVRNHTLRLHQTAISVKSDYSRQVASDAYKMYLTYFKDSAKHSEMRFFYAELLFDMKEYEKAAGQYQWVAENDKKSPYYEKAVINNVLALEKLLPSDAKMEQQRLKNKDKLNKVAYAPEVKKFEQASILYLKAFPKGEKAAEIRKRLGGLYYVHNDFEPAMTVFRGIIKDSPKSKDAPIAAEYILDIHNIRSDIDSYQKDGTEFLKNPTIASSPVGREIKENLNKVNFLKADTLSKGGKYSEAGKAFEAFAKAHPGSPQAFSALFNAGVNYEKDNNANEAIRVYEQVLAHPGHDKTQLVLKQEVRNSLAEMYRKMGQLEKSAQAYDHYAAGAPVAKAKAALTNASILWMSLGNDKKVLADYAQLDKMSSEKEKTERLFDRAEMYYRAKDWNRAVRDYDDFLRVGWRDTAKSLKAMYNIGEISEKRGQNGAAKAWFDKTITFYKERRGKAGVRYAAQAKFWLTQRYLTEMKAVHSGSSEKSIVEGFQRLKNLQKTLISNLAEVIRYDYGPSIVAALAAEAESYEIISRAFSKSPVPREYAKAEQAKQFKDLANQEAAGFLAKAKGTYKAAFEKGLALEAYGEPLLASARNYYRLAPDEAQQAGEITTVGTLLDRTGL